MNKRYLLIDEYPLFVSPTLAAEMGLNQAIIIQQLNYWLQRSNHHYKGKTWIYNTYNNWQEQFPFWSLSTIWRTIADLEKRNIIITGNFNKFKLDQTKWYTLNYKALSCSDERQETLGSKLFINERLLTVLPSLAVLTGLPEALLLQEIHYNLVEIGTNIIRQIGATRWVKLSNKQLGSVFRFLSERQLRRIIATLRDKGFLKVSQLDCVSGDSTNYYSNQYEVLLNALRKEGKKQIAKPP